MTTVEQETKRCSRCGPVAGPKPLNRFCLNRAAKDGRQPWCRDCVREYQRRWTAATRAKTAALSGKQPRDRAATAAARAELVLAAVCAVWAREGRPPTLSEVAAGAGLRHVSSALWHLRGLERAGKVELDRPRGLGWNRAVWPAGLRSKIKAAANGG